MSGEDVALGKRALRQAVRARLAGWPPEARRKAGREAAARLDSLDAYREARRVFAFVGHGEEIDTLPLLQRIASDPARTLCVPRIVESADGSTMEAVPIDRMDQLVAGRFGIPAPADDLPTAAPDSIDCVLVPGLAFDASGGRLGKGRAYYDRWFARAGGRPRRIAFAAELQIVDRVPVEPHDVPMHWIVTDCAVRAVDGGVA